MTTLYNKAWGPFYDEWEGLPEDDRQVRKRKMLDEYINYARGAVSWHADRLAGYDSQSNHPLKAVPSMAAADLRHLLPPESQILLTHAGGGYNVFQSGGTTGQPKTTLFSHAELEALNDLNGRGFYAVGLKPEDRVANLWAVGGLYMTFIHMNRMLQQYGCINFPFSNHTDKDFIKTVATLFKINCFTGIASVVLAALRFLHENKVTSLQIDKIYYGGEHFYDADREEVRAKFGTEVIAAPGYGTVDTWYIGYQCSKCQPGEFHAHDDQGYIEIVDEVSGDLCAAGTPGMVYMTPFPRRLTPIVRYRVGDRAKWLGGGCGCGRTTPRFKLLGRGDDVLRIGYDSVDYEYVQKVCLGFSGTTGSIQMEKNRTSGKDQLIVRIECELAESERPALSEQLARALVEGRPTLRKAIAEQAVHPLKLLLVNPQSLKRNDRTGKLIRVIDAIGDE